MFTCSQKKPKKKNNSGWKKCKKLKIPSHCLHNFSITKLFLLTTAHLSMVKVDLIISCWVLAVYFTFAILAKWWKLNAVFRSVHVIWKIQTQKKKRKEILPGCKLRKNDDRHLWTAWLWLFKISNLINRDIQNNWRCLLIMTNQFSLSNQPLFWDEWTCHNMEIRFVLLSWLCFID